MKSSRVLTGALIAGSVAVASMFAAAPASAASLPAGAKITVVDDWNAQFYNVSPANADSSAVGTPAPIAETVSGVDVDDTGLGYAVANLMVPQETEDPEDIELEIPAFGWIYKADANTGKLTDGKQVVIDTGDDINTVANECSAIDYSKGVILAVCYSHGRSSVAYIGTVDVSGASAVLTPGVTLNSEGYIHFTAIAVNPINGVVWGFDDTYPFDPQVWTITFDGNYPEEIEDVHRYVLGADFDRSGQLWLSVSFSLAPTLLANLAELELATFDFTTNLPVVVYAFSSADPYEIDRPEAITVWGVLAATGSTASPVAPAIAASLILFAGAILAAGTLVLRRRNADA